jgi:hypothetical protein
MDMQQENAAWTCSIDMRDVHVCTYTRFFTHTWTFIHICIYTDTWPDYIIFLNISTFIFTIMLMYLPEEFYASYKAGARPIS